MRLIVSPHGCTHCAPLEPLCGCLPDGHHLLCAHNDCVNGPILGYMRHLSLESGLEIHLSYLVVEF